MFGYERIYKKVIIAAKRLFTSKYTAGSDNNIKATWNVINKISGKSKSRPERIISKKRKYNFT